jgi:hypothetical protein
MKMVFIASKLTSLDPSVIGIDASEDGIYSVFLSRLFEGYGFRDIRFTHSGRVRWLCKYMVCSAGNPAKA